MATRRAFLGGAALAGLGLAAMVHHSVHAYEEDGIRQFHQTQPSEDQLFWEKNAKPLRAALIGSGWYGKSDLFRLIQCGGEHVEVKALCDVNQHTLEEAGRLVAERHACGKVPNLYHDYRELLEKEQLDVCLIGSPDHWHPLQMIAACEAGCDVYVQKPIGVDVLECAAMYETARRTKRVVQVGLQRRSTPLLIEAKQRYVDSNNLGQIAYVNTFCDYGQGNRVLKPIDPPEHLDWKFFCGPSGPQPFYPNIGWRQFKAFGNGTIGDMGVHIFDMVRWMLGLGWPKKIYATGGILVNKTGVVDISDTLNASFLFDDLTVTWEHRHWSEVRNPRYGWGAEFFGTKGTMLANPYRYDFHAKNQPWIRVDASLEYDKYPTDEHEPGLERNIAGANRAHMWNFLARIIDRKRPNSDIEEGYISSACCILANLSQELGGAELEWNPETKLTNDARANELLARKYHESWVHP